MSNRIRIRGSGPILGLGETRLNEVGPVLAKIWALFTEAEKNCLKNFKMGFLDTKSMFNKVTAYTNDPFAETASSVVDTLALACSEGPGLRGSCSRALRDPGLPRAPSLVFDGVRTSKLYSWLLSIYENRRWAFSLFSDYALIGNFASLPFN